ncbi:MAG: MMPL family transporter [Pseudomonadota bacterium]
MGSGLEIFFCRYLRFANRHRWLCCFFAVALFAASLLVAGGLELRSSLKELLPPNSPAVVWLDRMLDRVGGISVLTVTIESPDPQANMRFADDLTAKVSALPEGEVRYVISNIGQIRQFYENNALHYIDLKDLGILYDRVKMLVDYEKFKRSPLFFDLGEEERPVTLKIDDIRERNEKNVRMPLATYQGYYGGEEGRFLIVMIRPQGAAIAIDKARDLIAKVKGIVDGLGPASYDPTMSIGYCGNVMTTVEEYDTLRYDMVSTAGLCILLVAAAIAVYFLRIRIVAFLGMTLLLGITLTFAVTKIVIGYLNAQTAFLASIIIGTGINYGIILVGRYLEERKAGLDPRLAMEHALANTVLPTFLAAGTTAASFVILMIARVRGLSQFGFIGSVGIMSCWLVTILFLPLMVVMSESVLKIFRKLSSPKRKSALVAVMENLLNHFPAGIVIISAIMALLAALVVWRYVPNSIEYDFSKLRNRISAVEGTEALERRVAKLWVGSMTPAVVLLDKREDGPAACDSVMKQNDLLAPDERMVDSCFNVYDLLPPDQQAKIPMLTRFDRLLSERWIGEVEGDLGAQVRRIKRSLEKKVLDVSDLPDDLVRNFKDLDGDVGTFAYINPRSGRPLTDGRNLMRFTSTVQDIGLPDGRVLHATGESLIFADLVKIVKEEAPILTLASFVAVAAFVLYFVRKRKESYVVLVALVWAVLIMVAAMALLDIRINFFNFIALPLTFGIGVDYSLNIAMRLYREDKREVSEVIRHTGGAVVLCSLTTTIGYFVLTRSTNQAVAQFGVVAIIGEFTSIFAAMFLVPALIIMGRHKKGRV